MSNHKSLTALLQFQQSRLIHKLAVKNVLDLIMRDITPEKEAILKDIPNLPVIPVDMESALKHGTAAEIFEIGPENVQPSV